MVNLAGLSGMVSLPQNNFAAFAESAHAEDIHT